MYPQHLGAYCLNIWREGYKLGVCSTDRASVHALSDVVLVFGSDLHPVC